MTDNNFKQLFDQNLMMLQDIKADIRDLKEDVSNLKTDVAVVKADVQNVKNEVNDLKQTVTNHINQDIHETNKKKLSNTPNWVFILLVFFIGRLSISIFDIYDQNELPRLESQSQSFAPPSSTLTVQKKSTNKKVDDMIIKKLIGE